MMSLPQPPRHCAIGGTRSGSGTGVSRRCTGPSHGALRRFEFAGDQKLFFFVTLEDDAPTPAERRAGGAFRDCRHSGVAKLGQRTPARKWIAPLVVSSSARGGGGGQQNAATRRNMRREQQVTVQGPVKKQQPDGMSHRGGGPQFSQFLALSQLSNFLQFTTISRKFSAIAFCLPPLPCSVVRCVSLVQKCCSLRLPKVWLWHRHFPQFGFDAP